MAVSGPFDKLAQLAKTLKRLEPSQSEIARRTAARFAGPLSASIKREFAAGADPYGNAWEPLKARTLAKGRRPPPLTATGKARDSVFAVALGPKDRASVADYLRYHMKKRPVLPQPGQWPPSWVREVMAIAERVTRELLAGRR